MNIIPIIIVSVNLLILISLFVIKKIQWLSSRPKEHIANVGIRYNKGAIKNWPNLDCMIFNIYQQLKTTQYKDKVDEFMSKVIVEVVPYNGTRVCPLEVVSAQYRCAGSIDFEKQYPWSKDKNYVAVVLQLQEYDTADKSSVAHEIIRHLWPIYINNDLNSDHRIPELNQMSDKIEIMCHKKV